MTDHPMTLALIDGKSCELDARIADDLCKLNASGFRTLFSCQGDNEDGSALGTAYVMFDMDHDLLAPVFSAARSAGFEVWGNSIQASPGNHHDAVREIGTEQHQLHWNAQFRRFLHMLAKDGPQANFEECKVTWEVHPCEELAPGVFVDTLVQPAYEAWILAGGAMTDLCHGDQDLVASRPLVSACIRWRAPAVGIPEPLQAALSAVGFNVWDFGAFSRYPVKSSPAHSGFSANQVGSRSITPERMVAMNRVFAAVLLDYAKGTIGAPAAYVRRLERERRALRAQSISPLPGLVSPTHFG